MADFDSDDFAHTAMLLRSGHDGVVSATLSNNLNIILAALDFASITGIGRLRFMRRVMDQGHIKLSIEQVDEIIADFDAIQRNPPQEKQQGEGDAQ